jgi:hypothetical protein
LITACLLLTSINELSCRTSPCYDCHQRAVRASQEPALAGDCNASQRQHSKLKTDCELLQAYLLYTKLPKSPASHQTHEHLHSDYRSASRHSQHRYPAPTTTQLTVASNPNTHRSSTSPQQHGTNLWIPLVDSKRSVSLFPPSNRTSLTSPRSCSHSSCTFLPHFTPPAGHQVPQP